MMSRSIGSKALTEPPQRVCIRAIVTASVSGSVACVQPGLRHARPAKSATGRMRFVGTEIAVQSP